MTDVTNSMATSPEVTLIPDPSRLMDLASTPRRRQRGAGGVPGGSGRAGTPKRRGLSATCGCACLTRCATTPTASANLPLARRGDQLVTVGQVTSAQTEQSPTRIQRVNRQRIALLGADTNKVPLGTSTAATPEDDERDEPPGRLPWEFAGQASDQADSFRQLSLGLLASVVLMYMVLSILYENWLQPALILSALPLATVGAFAGLLLFARTWGSWRSSG